MIIETLSMGRLEVSEEQLYHFPKGIPGFEEETDYALITLEDTPFWVLQSLKEQGVSFLLTNPFDFYPGYEFELPDEEAAELQIEVEVLIRSIITLHENTEQSTINLLAPIVFNPAKRLGKQIVIHSRTYHTKHILLQEQPADGKDGG
ncbi:MULTISPECIES: flagellar assembly protein FliW [unclassified Paenibacillus]|uniref:flagellar assembly protein FliW n=1 Tax=unclassified Paenibacillus TaxID=185978 RepID=UPI0024065485|nr:MULTISPECIES: flagellar assembly protein FliW [unclassified Paenibacillus]MDF9840138.1 flagellar assembly factor FliW [Paenibacillus sp. PastF-2]MDF9846720.1 flagellar assembly factor FliW [Paenibacillus sp. PastM-2]MDF9852931.1 flagellar assembly factor FliW [Paenibacillus sp. PastF-1]MDH6478564.1 flagellar assembly factor FliW [Paenibacillus sp. PastH-2]MDH6505938.1 flagellar assembly factor FliW [Paenibacillus sp. PastM-3]